MITTSEFECLFSFYNSLFTFMNYSLYQQIKTNCLNHLLFVIIMILLYYVKTH